MKSKPRRILSEQLDITDKFDDVINSISEKVSNSNLIKNLINRYDHFSWMESSDELTEKMLADLAAITNAFLNIVEREWNLAFRTSFISDSNTTIQERHYFIRKTLDRVNLLMPGFRQKKVSNSYIPEENDLFELFDMTDDGSVGNLIRLALKVVNFSIR
jgi:hypothetical protein